jgi:pimeloyl-ACP methyl ester carboxylesterase
MSQLTSRVSAWQQAGTLARIAGHQIFVRNRAATGDGPPLLFLHGYPSSSYDWRHAFDLLPEHQVIAFDFLGYGLSDKPRDQVYSLRAQADIVEEIAAHFAAKSVILIAHDMGSSVATELLARDVESKLSFELESVVLFNASLVRERANLLWGQKLLLSRLGPLASRLTTEFAFRRQFAGIFSREHPLSNEEAADQWSLLRYKSGHRLLQRLIYYNHERVTNPTAARWHDALRDWPGQLELVWAELDPICGEAVLQAVVKLRPHAPITRLPGLGHYPQIEDPATTIAALARIVSKQAAPSPAGNAPTHKTADP